ELERNPRAEARELAERWIARGLPKELAHEVARALGENPAEALRVHAQEELGIDPHEQPSPWVAAGSSFLCFSIGALVPLAPYPAHSLAEDAGNPDAGTPESAGVRSALAINVGSVEEVDAGLAAAEAAGGRITRAAERMFWGGYSGYFADPDGHAWEVAYN